MRKKCRVKVVVLLMAFFILTSSVVAYAQSYTNMYVYGNEFKVMVDGTTDNSSNFVTVTLTDIYKADGSSSNYAKVRAKIYDGNNDKISVGSDVAVEKQKTTTILLIREYTSQTRMKLLMKGNNSSLDCIVNFAASISQSQ